MEKQKVVGSPALRRPIPVSNCPGCHYGLITRVVAEVLEEMGIGGQTIGVAGVGCCFGFFAGLDIDSINCAHGCAPSVATGIKHAHYGKPIVLTVQGDGDCASIGAGPLVNAAARAEKITIIMVNNGNYGTTGGQMAPTSLLGQVTTTTPNGRDANTGYPLHVPEMLATIKGVAYAARGAVNNPANLNRTKKYVRNALQSQIDGLGMSFVEILSACPPDWHLKPLDAMKWIEERMMAEYSLGEFKNNAEEVQETKVA